MTKRIIFFFLVIIVVVQCKSPEVHIDQEKQKPNFSWDNAIVYFLMTDRFNNGDKSNDFVHPETAPPAPYRGFMGGDIRGVTQKVEDSYFSDLGVNAIWTTPLLENIKGSVDEGTGTSYGFHGYWTKDWTAFDQRVTTSEDFGAFVRTCHSRGIRVIMDVIANHTGPVTPTDKVWPDEWVRTGPKCQYKDFESTVTCTLVENLPDIKTESTDEVGLPPFLITKWKAEGRYEQEVSELDTFFARTNYPRRPFYYIVKWLVDYIKEYGIDGFRVDTAKHTESNVWDVLYKEASFAFDLWKKEHPEEVLDDSDFYMVGEVYNYFVSQGKAFDYGDQKVDFYKDGFKALVNFDFKGDANSDYESIFMKYDTILHGDMKGSTILNYISSHDDGGPFDLHRSKTYESATKLLLTQGGAQIYYGDETARSLTVEAEGDAKLRSFMNWDALQQDSTKALLRHWQKLGKFRNDHIAIAAGRHQKLSNEPYTFSRTWNEGEVKDQVVVALNVAKSVDKAIKVGDVFINGDVLLDKYSGKTFEVKEGRVIYDGKEDIVLLEKKSGLDE